jgi:quinol-cytochrome oxidoreductase complex cytochrome b subunit
MSPFRLEKTSDAGAVPKRIALIRREAPARLLEDREEAWMTSPHLLIREVILFQICVIVLAIVSLAFDAPLEGIADPSHTPNPAKAPWYFLGLQELLHYFPPIVAGILLPALAVIGIVVIPYFRINLEVVGFYERPWKRNLAFLTALVAVITALMGLYRVWPVLVPTLLIFLAMSLPALPVCPEGVRRRLSRVPLADWIMHWFVSVVVTLTVIGTLFRGPGWSWVWPWGGGAH